MRKDEESKRIAIESLNARIRYIPHLKSMHPNHEKFLKWRLDTQFTLKNIYSENSDYYRKFENIDFDVGDYFISLRGKQKARFSKILDVARILLKSYVDEINTFWRFESDNKDVIPNYDNKNVFIIHGHDDDMKNSVLKFIRSLGLNPIILHEKPNLGNTIIEKFEKHANVTYAIAIFSPDDIGRKREGIIKEKLKKRARQNVVFEFGYFIGALSRERVCCLYSKGVELPSDYSGVLYISYDKKGIWKQDIIKEFTELNII